MPNSPSESLFIRSLTEGRNTNENVPVWLMRQAGRYSPAFLDLRAGMPFLDFCKQPELCVEATLLPLRELEVDAAILFADILLIPEAMGQDLEYVKGEGPTFANPLRSASDIQSLSLPRMQDNIDYVYEAVRQLRKALPEGFPLIGFAGAPFTVASYMVEGRSSKDYRNLKALMWSEDGTWDALMSLLTDATIDYLRQQVQAGADALQLFDSWADAISPSDWRRFVQPYVSRVFAGLQDLDVPLIYFGKGLGRLLPDLKSLSCTAIGFDQVTDLDAAALFLEDKAVQGNLDPVSLYAPEAVWQSRVRQLLRSMRGYNRFVFNLGHGLSPDHDLGTVRALTEYVHEYSREMALEQS